MIPGTAFQPTSAARQNSLSSSSSGSLNQVDQKLQLEDLRRFERGLQLYLHRQQQHRTKLCFIYYVLPTLLLIYYYFWDGYLSVLPLWFNLVLVLSCAIATTYQHGVLQTRHVTIRRCNNTLKQLGLFVEYRPVDFDLPDSPHVSIWLYLKSLPDRVLPRSLRLQLNSFGETPLARALREERTILKLNKG